MGAEVKLVNVKNSFKDIEWGSKRAGCCHALREKKSANEHLFSMVDLLRLLGYV
jgi:hypothetical protein